MGEIERIQKYNIYIEVIEECEVIRQKSVLKELARLVIKQLNHFMFLLEISFHVI